MGMPWSLCPLPESAVLFLPSGVLLVSSERASGLSGSFLEVGGGMRLAGGPMGQGAAGWSSLFLERWGPRTQLAPCAQLPTSLKTWLLGGTPPWKWWVGWLLAAEAALFPSELSPPCHIPGACHLCFQAISFCRVSPRASLGEGSLPTEWAWQMAPPCPHPKGGHRVGGPHSPRAVQAAGSVL